MSVGGWVAVAAMIFFWLGCSAGVFIAVFKARRGSRVEPIAEGYTHG